MYKYQSRDEVPEKYKWDLTGYFKNNEEFNKLLEKTKIEIKLLKEYRGCTKNATKVCEFLKKEIEVSSNVQVLYVYSSLKNDEILGIKENIERKSITLDLYNELETSISFFDEELIKLSKDEYNNLFIECENLKEFKPLLDKTYRKKEHTLSEKEENIISNLTNSMDNFLDIYSNLINREHDYGKVELEDKTEEKITINNFGRLMKNKDRNIRKQIYTNFYSKINEYAGTSALLLNSYVKGNNTLARIHNFKNAWEAKLFSLNLNDNVFKTLVSVTEENTEPLKKYYKLRKKILNLDELHSYDLGLDLIEMNKEYTIEEAQELIKEALKPLGETYIEKLNKAFKNRYIDYMGYKGKCSGGYSMPTRLKESRILLSYNSDLNSVSTIAHELGHNINHSFLIENCPLEYRMPSNLVAEVASLTNECLLSNYLMNNGKTKEEKLSGLENIIKIIRSNLFIAVREGKIEQDMYDYINDNGTISKEFLNDLVEKSLKKFQGNELKIDELDTVSWVTRTHYYYNFYLYSYAISICVAVNVAKEITSGNKKMLENYMKYLKTGSNVWPKEAFEILNIDLEDENVYKNAINYFDELVNNYEKIYYESKVSESE